ncbi:hypothetical protein EJ03DRAFT_147409 [Teratosphaeria nubilosa]|uniref:Uncharacterized protein n=1 Tax=Teratosphaeria nubilosa TaxID=161662 RepID=A0A6G1L3U2_9PEZI|nr:hypothetical protein EJ03DRAFT_147409 [Teratosphaeria nubilosa]
MVALIISLINQSTHATAVCLTSKTLRNLANGPPYGYAHLDEETPIVPSRRQHCSRALQCRLRIWPLLDCRRRTARAAEACLRIIMTLLQLMPRGCLREFDARTVVLDLDAITLLYMHQRGLTCFTPGPTRTDLHNLLSSPACRKNWLSGLTSLGVPGHLETVH